MFKHCLHIILAATIRCWALSLDVIVNRPTRTHFDFLDQISDASQRCIYHQHKSSPTGQCVVCAATKSYMKNSVRNSFAIVPYFLSSMEKYWSDVTAYYTSDVAAWLHEARLIKTSSTVQHLNRFINVIASWMHDVTRSHSVKVTELH